MTLGGIPGPRSTEDAAASIQVMANAAAAAQVALTGAQNNIAHAQHMQQNAEVQHASFIERMAKTDPVEAAAITQVTGNANGGNGHGSPADALMLAALGQIAARLEK